ncbi:hypothetical protein I5907_09035 [Panacibacter sp. DH6]|uniref:Transcription initiation factor TFIID subunit 2 n=1 Tax=Panacibacter microcysteis TaxID=2793269 RepID=A0A931GVG8_9BACT|nr:M1 family aminopeptidase [Panacibacter microcysteis]MBG9376375.1 hypothetical protein [Panacibacter microcysteis]
MRKKRCFVINALLFITTSLLARQPQTYIAGDGIDVQHYKINLEFDWQKMRAKADVKVSLLFTKPLQTVCLAANNLLIYEVKTGGVKHRFVTDTAGHTLIILLDKIYQVNDTVSISITYETLHSNEPDVNALGGSFGKGIRFIIPSTASPVRRRQLWSQSELMNTSYWLPCSASIADIATTEITATVEKGMMFLATGALVSRRVNDDDNSVTFSYKTTYPHPAYLTAFAAGEYTAISQTVNGVTLYTYCYPGEEAAAKATTVELPAMLQFLEKVTGFAYPYRQYTQVVVQQYPFPGLTGQHTFSIISDNMIDDYGTHLDYLYLWDGVECNALASQWFGNIIMPAKVQDMWLAKGFAQYFEGMYVAAVHGMEEYLLWYHSWETGNVMTDWADGKRHPIVPAKVDDAEDFVTDSYSKYRGALVLRMLREEMGDELFFKSVQQFVHTYAFKTVTTADFQRTVERVSQRSWQWFFDQWIYQTGHPVFDVKKLYDKSGRQLRLTVTQLQQKENNAAYEQPAYFRGNIELAINDSIRTLTLLPQEKNVFEIPFAVQPAVINLDPENIWIREINMQKSQAELEAELSFDKHTLCRSNAMAELVNLYKDSTTTAISKQKIIESLQTVINSNAYWRFRFNAIGQLRAIQPLPYDQFTKNMLHTLVQKETSWVKAAAITSLGITADSSYADLYISCFSDTSDRVISAAAIALGQSKSSKAFDALLKLKDKPSWKSQSLMHCLAGLAQLGDERGSDIAIEALKDNHSPRWFLGNAWDYPFVAVQTLVALGKTGKAYDILAERILEASEEHDISTTLLNLQLIMMLNDPKTGEIITALEKVYNDNEEVLLMLKQYTQQLSANK